MAAKISWGRGLSPALALVLTGLLLSGSLLPGCGSDDTSPTLPGTDDPEIGDLPPPDPAGVLLGGDPDAGATGAVTDLPPSPVAPDELHDGLLTTRLLAVLDPAASVAVVNASLEGVGGRIVSMRAGSPFVTLRIPAVTDADGASAVAGVLRAAGGFLHAGPAHGLPSDARIAGIGGRVLPPSGVGPEVRHLVVQGFPAAWNVARLAVENQEEITVLVPEEYASSAPHQEIDAQGIGGYGGIMSLPGPEIYPGNQGFVVSGIIGANFDDTPVTGTSPDPAELLDLESLPIGGLSWYDLCNLLAWQLVGSGDRFVLNTGLVYQDELFETWSPIDRALHALAWRVAAAPHYSKFVHVTSSGSDAEADLSSPFVASSRVDDLRDLVDLDEATEADSLALETAWATVLAAIPGTGTATPNLLVVAPANDAGQRLDGAAPGDVQAVGLDVTGPCVSADPAGAPGYLCDGTVAVYSGGGVAVAQVSGLAAYMLSLSDRTPAEVRSRIVATHQSSSTGLIDAYAAVRSLDSGPDGDVHRTLFDVAGVDAVPGHNDAFDEQDLEVFLGVLGGGFLARSGGGALHDRYDLNGDGVTHPTATAEFDVDGNGAIGTAILTLAEGTVAIDEAAARDVDVLCYHAYTDLYTGDVEVRNALLPLQHGEAFVEVSFPEVIEPGKATPITIRVGTTIGGGIAYLPDIEVDISASSAEVGEEDGLTDGAGTYATTITLDTDENDTEIRIRARTSPDVEANLSARRPNEIVFVGRESDTQVWVSASHRASLGSPLVVVYDHGEEVDLEDFTGGYQHDLTDEDDASGEIGFSSQARSRQDSEVSVVDGNQVTGAFLSCDVSGSSAILGDPDHYGYQAWSSSSVDFEVDIEVWGEPAAFSLSATISTPRYSVAFANVRCSDDQAPCSSISEVGELLPDQSYRLDANVYIYALIQQDCADDDPHCSTSGSISYDGSLTLSLSLEHPGGRESGASAPIQRRFVARR
jgi:hypothetical protein